MRTRFRKIGVWLFSALFSITMMFGVLFMTAFVEGSAVENPMSITTKTSYSIAKGVTLDQYIVRSKSQKQSIGYMTTVDLNQEVKILASYTGYYTEGSTVETRKANAATLQGGSAWSMSQTTRQATAYESIADAEGTVVVATNGDFFNMQTGKPSGYLVMEGNLITTGNTNGNEPYFAILKDGTAVIREAGTDTSDVAEAISGPYWLIKDNEIVADKNDTSLNPRNSVGIKADGSVVLFEFDGRQEPLSAGLNYYELACMLKDAGCVDALYLDGGGSATVAARKEGTDSLEVVNNPSDGIERTVSSALLVVSTAYPTGEFDHAVLSPNNEVYTPGSEVQFTADGVDPSGAPAPMPDAGTLWKLDTPAAGTIDEITGVFTAAEDYVGTVSVHLEYNGVNVGEVEILVAEPDELYFSSDSISLDYGQESDLGLTVSGGHRTIHYKDGDFEWNIIPEGDYSASAVGSIVNNVFQAGLRTDTSTSMRAEITVSYTTLSGNRLTDSIEVEVGKLPVVLMDFETQQANGLEVGANSVWGNTYSWNNQAEHGISGYDPDARGGTGGFGNADGTAKDPNGITIPATIEGDLGVACGDFVSGVGNCNCWHEAPYGWDCDNDPGALYREMGYNWTVGALSTAGDGAYNMYAQRVSSEKGEVRFDDYALEFHYDFTDITGTNNTNEMLVYTGEDVIIEGTPTGIGMWIYAPEGTPNFWLMTYIAYWNKSTNSYAAKSFHFGTTTVNSAGETIETKTQYTGINWSGWKYVEADISDLYSDPNVEVSEEHPLKYTAGTRLLNLIIIEGGTPDVDGNKITCGSREAGSLYIDNVRAVYGTTVDDMDNPVIDSVAIGPDDEDYNSFDELSADKENVLYTNNLQIFTRYHEYSGQYATGISEANTQIIVDGKELNAIALADQAVANVVLPNGRHSVKVEIMDGFGNKTSVEYAFVVRAPESDIPELGLLVSEDAWLGDNYVISLSTEKAEEIKEVTLTVNYGNIDKLDASTGLSDPRLTAAEITYGSQFEPTIYQHTNDKGQTYIDTPYQAERLTTTNKVVLMHATAKEGISGSGDIITFSMRIPPEMLTSDTLPIGFTVEYITTDGQSYTLGVPFADYAITPAYNLTADNMVAGGNGGNIAVVDYAGRPVSGVQLFLADGTQLGVTDEDGILATDYFAALPAGTSTQIYAMNEDGNAYSFKLTIRTLSAGGDASGKPMYVPIECDFRRFGNAEYYLDNQSFGRAGHRDRGICRDECL